MNRILILICVAAFILNIVVLGALLDMANWFSTKTVTTVRAPSQDAVIGLWGGKWDDTWPIFLSIETNGTPNTYSVHYRWLENLDDPTFSTEDFTGHKTDNYFHAKFLYFRATKTNAMLYGKFKNPRMANLVRLDTSGNPSLENIDACYHRSKMPTSCCVNMAGLRTVFRPVKLLKKLRGRNSSRRLL